MLFSNHQLLLTLTWGHLIKQPDKKTTYILTPGGVTHLNINNIFPALQCVCVSC